MPQTEILSNPAVGQAGQPARAGYKTINRFAAEAIEPGKFVVITVNNDKTCELPDADSEVDSGRGLGVAMLDSKRSTTTYAAGDVVTIIVDGEVWVKVEDSSTAGAAPFVRYTATGNEELGSFRSDADTADADAVPNAVFTSTQSVAGKLAKVKLGGVFS